MENNKKDRRKSLLAEKIEPFEFPFDATSWQSFEALHAAKSQQKRTFQRQIAQKLGIFLVLASACLWLFQNKLKPNEVVFVVENNFSQKGDPSVYEANLGEKRILNDGKSNQSELITSLMFSNVPEGLYIYNRRFQSAGTDLWSVPLSRRDNILGIKCCLSETKSKIFDVRPPIEIGGYKYFVPNGTALLQNINSLDKNQLISPLNTDNDKAINSKTKDLIVQKMEKGDPSVSAAIFDKKTLLSALSATKNDDVSDDFDSKIKAELPIKNAGNKAELANHNANDVASNNATINVGTNAESINANELGPLSIKSFLDTISSNSDNLLPLIPQFKSKLLPKSPKNELMIGYGESSIYAGNWRHKAYSAIYLRRITPLMALGLNTSYTQGVENTHTFSADAQLNFTLFYRPRLGLYLTTGYGFRTWRLDGGFDKRGQPVSFQIGQSKGVSVGLDARISPIKNYFLACRLEMKDTYEGNFTFSVQIGKLF